MFRKVGDPEAGDYYAATFFFKKGHSVNAVFAGMPDDMIYSEKTVSRYLNSGSSTARNMKHNVVLSTPREWIQTSLIGKCVRYLPKIKNTQLFEVFNCM